MADKIIEVPGYGQVAFPDSMSDDSIAAAIKNNMMRTPLPEKPANLKQPEPLSAMDRMLNKLPTKGPIAALGNFYGDVAAGASGLMRGGANLISDGLGDKIWPTLGARNGVGRTIGELADPVAWTIGGGVAKVLPYAPVLGKGAVEGGKALLGNALSGAAAGGAIGALSEKGNAGTGAAVGAVANTVLPPVIGGVLKGATAAKNYIRPTPESLAVKAAGDKTDDVIQALLNSKSTIPGYKPTVAEAAVPAGSTEFSALQKRASQKNPSLYRDIDIANDEALVNSIRGIGQNKPALEQAVLQRGQAADPLYKAARNSTAPVDTTKIVDSIDDLLQKNPGNPALVRELNVVRNGLFDGKTPRTNAEEIASVVDGLKTAIANKDNAFIRGQLTDLKTAISDAIPGYQQAQKVFADKSIPVNQMRVGQELEKSLTNAIGTDVRATPFANAIREAPRTIKRSTGLDRFDDLSQILSPQQNTTVNNVLGNLRTSEQLGKMSSLGMANLDNRIGAPVIPPTGMFQPVLSAARGWVNKALGTGVEQGIEKLSVLMAKDPQQFARLMQSATPQQRQAIESMLSQFATRGAIVGGGVLSQP